MKKLYLLIMIICVLSCSTEPNSLVKVIKESDEVLFEFMDNPTIIQKQYFEDYPPVYICNYYHSFSYFACCNNGDTLYYDWSGKRLPFDDKKVWPDSIRQKLHFYVFPENDLEYISGDAVRDCNLEVVISEPYFYLWKIDSCWVFIPDVFHVKDRMYDLNGELLWQSSDGWEIKDVNKCDKEHLRLQLKRKVDGAENDEEMTMKIKTPVTPEQSHYCYSMKDGFHFLSPQTELQNVYILPSVVDMGLSVRWTLCNFDATVGEIMLNNVVDSTYSWSDESYKKYGNNFRLPTEEEMKELLSDCVWTRMGKKGNAYLVTSKNNGNSIVIPASQRYWTSTLKEKKTIQSAANEFNDIVLEQMYEDMYKTDDVNVFCLSLKGNNPQIDVANQDESLSIRLVMKPNHSEHQDAIAKNDTIMFNHPQLDSLILPRIPFSSLDSMTSAEMLRIGYFYSRYHLADTIKVRCERLGLGGYNFPEDYLKTMGKKKFREIHKKLKQMPQRSDATPQERELYLSMMDELATIIRTYNTGRPLLEFYQEDDEDDIKINGKIK